MEKKKKNNISSIFDECLGDFSEWLGNKSDVNGESVGSYISYIRGAFGILKEKFGENFISIEKKKLSKDKKNDLMLVEGIMTKVSESEKNKKTLQNYLSGYRMFEEFLLDESKSKKYRIHICYDKVKTLGLAYEKSALSKEFFRRLTTQDRKIGNKKIDKNTLMYPVRLIDQIFNNNKAFKADYKSFLFNEIFNIDFIIDEDDNRKKFKDISYLYFTYIPNGENKGKYETSIRIKKNREYIVYSKSNEEDKPHKLIAKALIKKNEDGTYKNSGPLHDVTIDHNIPIDEELKNNKNKYKCLAKLTDMIVGVKKDKIKPSSIPGIVFNKHKDEFGNQFCKNLLKEMKEISKNVNGFKILSQSDNSSKKNKLVY